MLRSQHDKSASPNYLEDLQAFTPDASARLENHLNSLVYSNVDSAKPISDEVIETLVGDCIGSFSDELISQLIADDDGRISRKRIELSEFEVRLNKRWRVPLDLLDLFVELNTDAGASFNGAFRAKAVLTHNVTFKTARSRVSNRSRSPRPLAPWICRWRSCPVAIDT